MLLAQEQKLLLIGQLARESGIPIKTIRYYEDLGLIASSGRTEGQYRLFKPDAIDRLAFIKTIQKLGLSLQEVAGVLQIYDSGKIPCDEIKQQLEHQICEIDRRIAELVSLRAEIDNMLNDWTPSEKATTIEICPILKKHKTK